MNRLAKHTQTGGDKEKNDHGILKVSLRILVCLQNKHKYNVPLRKEFLSDFSIKSFTLSVFLLLLYSV